MPALITHYLFGEEALNRGFVPGLDNVHLGTLCARRAFYLGCQGPDPFFFCFTSPRGAAARKLGSAMHRGRMARSFEQLRGDVDRLPTEQRPAGRAFVLGMLAHYALDRVAHPYVYAMQYALGEADPDLAAAHSEVHAIIESEIDCGVLDRYRRRSTAEFPPVGVLERDETAERAAGALLAETASVVFGIGLRPADYAGALADMRLCYRMIEPYEAGRSRRLGALERSVRPHSLLVSLAHRTDLGEENPSMNPGRLPWDDPFKAGPDGAPLRSVETFGDVFERALEGYADLAARFAAGEACVQLTGCLDYSGRALGSDEEDAGQGQGKPL